MTNEPSRPPRYEPPLQPFTPRRTRAAEEDQSAWIEYLQRAQVLEPNECTLIPELGRNPENERSSRSPSGSGSRMLGG